MVGSRDSPPIDLNFMRLHHARARTCFDKAPISTWSCHAETNPRSPFHARLLFKGRSGEIAKITPDPLETLFPTMTVGSADKFAGFVGFRSTLVSFRPPTHHPGDNIAYVTPDPAAGVDGRRWPRSRYPYRRKPPPPPPPWRGRARHDRSGRYHRRRKTDRSPCAGPDRP